jgi:hypothetical protein
MCGLSGHTYDECMVFFWKPGVTLYQAYNELQLQQQSIGAIDEHDVPKQQAPLVRYLATILAAKAQACWWSKHGCCGTMIYLCIHIEQKTQGKNIKITTYETLHLEQARTSIKQQNIA